MTEPDDYFLKHHKYEEIYFDKLLKKLKHNNNYIREKFISEKFTEIFFFKEDCYSTFFVQFIPFFDYLVFSKNDEEVMSKLKKLKFTNSSLKCLIDIDDLEREIRRLDKIEGLLILPYTYLFACYSYLTTKFTIEVYESFFGIKNYNGIEVNKLFLDSYKRSRRKNIKSNLDESGFDSKMRGFSYKMDEVSKNHFNGVYNSTKSVLKLYNNNFIDFISLFKFKNTTISVNKALEELFPLFQLIFKDKQLLNEDDFYAYYNRTFENSGQQYYDKNYRKYKISKVRDILKKK